MENQQETTLGNLVAGFNAKVGRKLLTDDNFEVVSIRKRTPNHIDKTNTIVEVSIDMVGEDCGPVLVNETKARKFVRMYRPSLNEAFELAGFEVGKDKAWLVGNVSDLDTVIGAVGDKLAIEESDIDLVQVSDGFIFLHANPNSLGFTGSVTLTDQANEEEPGLEPEPEPVEPPPAPVAPDSDKGKEDAPAKEPETPEVDPNGG